MSAEARNLPPRGWLATRFRHEAQVTLGKMLQSEPKDEDDRLLPYARAASVGQNGQLITSEAKSMWFSKSEAASLVIEPNDVLVVEGGDVGRSVIVKEGSEGWGFQNSILRVRASGDNDPRFIHFALVSARESGFIRAYCDAVSIPHLTAEKLNRLPLLVPPPPAQRAIADYLDRETARIDTLIEEQQRLIEILRERRDSAITEAVTSADRAEAQATSSAWYPSLPTRWQLGRVKSVAKRVTDGAHISPETEGGVFDFVSTRNLESGVINFGSALKTTPESFALMVRTGCQPKDGDVLFSKDGTVGETAVVRGNHAFVVASSLVIVTPDSERIDSNFLSWVFASKTAKEQSINFMRGAGLPRLSVGNLARLEVPLPPLDEQHQIAAYLDEQTAKIDQLIAETEKFIELSRERRSALITAAVTGQIDVTEAA